MRQWVKVIVIAALVGACGTNTPTPSPAASPVPGATPAPTPASTLAPSPGDSTSPSPDVPEPTEIPEPGTTTPSPATPSGALPAPGFALNVEGTAIAAGRNGILFVTVARRSGALLAALGPDGQPMPGWPVAIPDSTVCSHVLPLADGSVRVVCDATDLPRYDIGASDERAFGFGPAAGLLPGWPVRLPPTRAARAVGTDLIVITDESITDTESADVASHRARLVSVQVDGTVNDGDAEDLLPGCCGQWAIGPEGGAFAADPEEWDGELDNLPRQSTVTAMDLQGIVTTGAWPAVLDGLAIGPAFGPDGRLFLTMGSAMSPGGSIQAIDGRTGAAWGESATLPLPRVQVDEVDCSFTWPDAPVVDGDGRVFITIGGKIHSLDGSLASRPGWPVRLPGTLEQPGISRGGLDCFPAVPPIPDGRGGVFLLLAAGADGAGGSIVDLDEGGVRPGWPVGLRKPGAQFWRAAVGDDGTVYALAVEPEGSRRWSATVVALAPDSTVRYRTTVLEP